MRIGAHVSISRGPRAVLELAAARGCETLQVFSSNPRGWALPASAARDDAELRALLDAAGIRPVLVHAPYLVNVAAADDEVYVRSVASLVHATQRACRLDGHVVVHAGRHSTGPRERGVQRAASAVRSALKLCPDGRILIEPTAGGRGSVASRMDELGELLDACDDERVGVCLDTCHAHAAGYDLSAPRTVRAWLDDVERHVGFARVVALHANDSRDPSGSGRDRHWHLGEGTIGDAGFRAILRDARLRDAAALVETPGDDEDDRRNVERLRRLATVRRRGTT